MSLTKASQSVLKSKVTSVSANYTATEEDGLILVDSSGGSRTITLPSAANNDGKTLTIKKTTNDFNVVTVQRDGTDTIRYRPGVDSPSTSINTEGEVLVLICNESSSQWVVSRSWAPSIINAYTPTFTGFGTVSSVDCTWYRLGPGIILTLRWGNGTVSATEARVSLPSGLTADSVVHAVGWGGNSVNHGTTGFKMGLLNAPGQTYVRFYYRNSTTYSGNAAADGSRFTNNAFMTFQGFIPIDGWGLTI